MAKQDYYELLGVSRDATDGEIKKAFRGLARELHPDVSEAPDAEERFREVAEAYEVLSDDDRRARYDRYGHEAVAGQGFHTERFMDLSFLDDLLGSLFGGGFAGATGPEAGADAQAAIDIDLADAATGVHIDLDLELVSTCEVCEGDGAAPGRGRADLRASAAARARSGRSCARRSGSSCARLRAASAPDAGRSRSGPAPIAAAAAGARCGARSASTSRRASTTARPCGSRATGTPASSARRPAISTCACTCAPTSASCATGSISIGQLDLRFSEAALGTTRTVDDARRRRAGRDRGRACSPAP